VTARRSPFEAIQHAFGMTESSIRTLSAAAELLNDPHARGLIDQLSSARLRTQGATVLAPVHF
jgi:protease-4